MLYALLDGRCKYSIHYTHVKLHFIKMHPHEVKLLLELTISIPMQIN